MTYVTTLTASGAIPVHLVDRREVPSPGLKLARTGAISGKATTAGTYDFTAQVLDTRTKTTPSTQRVATAQLSITVVPAPLQFHGGAVSPATRPERAAPEVAITGTGLTRGLLGDVAVRSPQPATRSTPPVRQSLPTRRPKRPGGQTSS